ncbi:hypothetical protein ACFL6D_02025 [Spirochaetota bacterium]
MTSKERVNAAIKGEKADRTPTDFRAEAEVFEKIRNKLSLGTDEDVWMKYKFAVKNENTNAAF